MCKIIKGTVKHSRCKDEDAVGYGYKVVSKHTNFYMSEYTETEYPIGRWIKADPYDCFLHGRVEYHPAYRNHIGLYESYKAAKAHIANRALADRIVKFKYKKKGSKTVDVDVCNRDKDGPDLYERHKLILAKEVMAINEVTKPMEEEE